MESLDTTRRRIWIVGNIQLVALPAIAHVHRAMRNPVQTFFGKLSSAAPLQFDVNLVATFHCIARQHHRSREIAHRIGEQNPDRRKRSGHRRYQHTRNAQRAGKRAGMQRTAAAKSHQRELARIVPSLDRDDADRLLHLCVDHAKYASRKLLRAFSASPFARCRIASVRRRSRCMPPPRKLASSSRPSRRFASVTVG